MTFIQTLKSNLRKLLINLKFDVTKNLEYDRLTELIFKQILTTKSNTIDVGCHKGEILDLFLKYAPEGKHYAFEPLPTFYHDLVKKYKQDNVSLFNFALSKNSGEAEFTFVKNNPAYSGFIERDYDNMKPELEIIKVQKAVLDEIIPENIHINLMKIDVEGAELEVLQGAINTIKRCMPVIVFEHGIGASDYYATLPKDIYELLHDGCGLNIFTLKGFSSTKKPLTFEEFNNKFFARKEYYFVASK